MPESVKTVFVDQEVTPQVLSIFEEAAKYAVAVTPYLKLWGHARFAIERALKRDVEVRFFLRADSDGLGEESTQWLSAKGVRIQTVVGLHAKIFLNEQKIIVTSMNLHSSSSQNSLEVAMLVTDPHQQHVIRHYVSETLQGIATPLAKPIQSQTPTHSAPRKVLGTSVALGHCIRCDMPVELDPSHPLCDRCYDEWAEWRNMDYPERICHTCGRPAGVSYARPLCPACYQRS